MNFLGLRARGRLARTDRPDGLIGQNNATQLLDRQRIEYSLQLTTNHGFSLTGFALGQRLANTDHRNNVEFQRAQCLGSHYRVGFTMVGTTL